MRSPEQLENFRNKVELYLDNALTNEESIQVVNDAKLDPQYARLLQSESSFRNLVKTKVKRSICSENLINNIKDRIKI